LKKAERVGLRAIAQGKAKQIYTRKLHVRFTEAGKRNFLGDADRSADTLGSAAIRKQAKRLRKFVHGELARMRGKSKPTRSLKSCASAPWALRSGGFRDRKKLAERPKLGA
jgi:RNA-directed DNA polymerase